MSDEWYTNGTTSRERRAFLRLLGAGAAVGLAGCGQQAGDGTTTDGTTGTTTDETTTADTTEPTDATTEETTEQPPERTTIGFAGDTMVGRTLNDVYGDEDVDPASIWGDFRPHLQAVDGVFAEFKQSFRRES